MSPHKPDPIVRKVDVDLSAILIRSEELDRLGAKYEHELPDISSGAGRDSLESCRLASITSSEWASITFAIGACLIGIVCTLWTVDDWDQVTQLAYPAPDAIYVRPQLRAETSARVVSQRPPLPARMQLSGPETSTLKETTDSLEQAQPSSRFSPALGNNTSPLLANNASSASTGSTSGKSTGPSRASMSGNDGSKMAGVNQARRGASKGARVASLSRQTRRPTTSSTKVLRVRQGFVTRTVSASRQSKISKSPWHTSHSSAGHTSSARTAMSMHSARNGASMLQNRAGSSSMHMQHGMGAQQSAIGGLNGGLNGAGLGGGMSGGKHGGANACR
jgi:hypothetical protein